MVSGGDGDGDPRAFAGRGVNADLPPVDQRALLDVVQAQTTAPARCRQIKTLAVIGDHNLKVSVLLSGGDIKLAGAGMAHHVADGFVGDLADSLKDDRRVRWIILRGIYLHVEGRW